jgi:hypothetical protein
MDQAEKSPAAMRQQSSGRLPTPMMNQTVVKITVLFKFQKPGRAELEDDEL